MNTFSDNFIAHGDVLGFKQLVADAEHGAGMPLPDQTLFNGRVPVRFDITDQFFS